MLVFHFANGTGSPTTFTESVRGIELESTPDRSVASGKLGRYLLKSNDGELVTSDGSLDLGGRPDPISVMGWVSLAEGQADVIPWSTTRMSARHRELFAKLPGYRLVAVRGEISDRSQVATRPFFNLSEGVPSTLQDNVLGLEAIPAGEWTMLTGTYDGKIARLYVNDQDVAQNQTMFIPGTDGDGELRVGLYLHGGIDEIRISSVNRSQAWIEVQYASMTDSLFSFGETVEFAQP